MHRLQNTQQCIGTRSSANMEGAVAQSVERTTPGEEVLEIAAVAARSLLVGSVSV